MNCALLEWVARQDDLSPHLQGTLLRLVRLVDATGSLAMSQVAIATAIKLSERQARQNIKDLVLAGALIRARRGGIGKGRSTDVLTPNLSRQPATGDILPLSANGDVPPVSSLPREKPEKGGKSPVACQPVDNTKAPYKERASARAATEIITTSTVELNSDRGELAPKRKKRGGQFNPDWFLGENGRTFANGVGFLNGKADALFERFKDHHLAKGSIMVDWDAAWRTWVRNEIKFKGSPQNEQPRPQQASPNRRRARSVETEILMRDILDDQPISNGRLDFSPAK